ncbi:complement C1q tumor necrosis factor-related protein 4-like [Pholidichthys leucotaenia]
MGLSVLLLVGLVSATRFCWAMPTENTADLQKVLEELKSERLALNLRLDAAEKQLKRIRETPKIAFAASLGGNGLMKTTSGNKDLIYRDVLTNVGGAYDPQTGVFTAPIRGVYYVRFTANAPTDFPMSAVLYKNGVSIQLIAHEQKSGEGSDTASNGAALLLEAGDKLKMELWHNTQIWDNQNHHSTISGFLVFPMIDEPLQEEESDVLAEIKNLQTDIQALMFLFHILVYEPILKRTHYQEMTNRLPEQTSLSCWSAGMKERLGTTEEELKAIREVPKVAFSASLGGNGLQKTTSGSRTLIYRDVLTNIGQAYNLETGVFTAPIRGVYYVRFTANAPTDFPMSAVLYKNDVSIQLIVHEQPSGEGSDTASNGAALQLEAGDTLKVELWHNTQIWDNSNRHSTITIFLLFSM